MTDNGSNGRGNGAGQTGQSGITPFLGGLIGTGALIGGGGNTPAIGKPFAREIFLIETHIAGTMYVDDLEEALQSVEVGTRLYFFREPENRNDPLAIVIRNKDGQKLGYVPKKNNEIISRLMDAGKLIYGVLEETEQVDHWTRLTIQIMMND